MEPIPYYHYQIHVVHYPYRWTVMTSATLAVRNKSLPHSCFAKDVWLQSLSLHICQKLQGLLPLGSLLACSDHRVVSYYIWLLTMDRISARSNNACCHRDATTGSVQLSPRPTSLTWHMVPWELQPMGTHHNESYNNRKSVIVPTNPLPESWTNTGISIDSIWK